MRPGSSASKRATAQGTVLDEAALSREMSDPRLGDDVPPVPRIPSSLNLPGTYPRDASPVRPDTSKSGKQRANGESTGASPKSQRHAGGGYTSTSTATKRGNSRPTSSKGTGAWSEITVSGTTKVDLGKLLAGIHPGSDAGVAQEMEDGGALPNKPPY